MKKLAIILFIILLSLNIAFTQDKNLNTILNGQEQFVNGLRELTEKDWKFLNSLPQLKAVNEDGSFRKILLPQSINNSTSTYFRPIFNQANGSCGQASGIGYTFTYEMCLKRDVPANSMTNLFPTHYTYNFLNEGSGSNGSWYFDGWMIGKENGIPNAVTYEGDINPLFDNGWMTGYENYLAGMDNRTLDIFSINVSTPEGLETMKQWMFDRANGSDEGGLVCFAAGAVYPDATLPHGTPEAGMDLITFWGPEVNHAMTFVGYNDSIRYDFNSDGQYTNDIDITGDGIVDLRDWEIGGIIVVNSWGNGWGNSGRSYMMYRLLAEEVANGGIWTNTVHGINVKESYSPILSIKTTIEYDSRDKIKISAGVATNLSATEPEFIKEFPLFDYQGGDFYMQGGTLVEENKTIEIGLDITDLLDYIDDGVEAKFFLQVDESDDSNVGTGQVVSFSVIDHSNGDTETISDQTNVTINNNDVTYLSLQKTISFDPVVISTTDLPEVIPDEEYSYQLTASGGTEPYYWSIIQDYEEETLTEDFPGITTNLLTPTDNDDGYVIQSLDFSFPFFGEDFDQLTISTDGSILFGENFVYLRDEEALIQYKAISVYGADLKIFPDESDGIWYEGDENSATFRWKAGMWQHPEVDVDVSVKLYPSGNIEFFYGENITVGSDWVAGISNGEGDYTLASVSGTYDLADNYSLRLNKPEFPDGFEISDDGMLNGITSESSESWEMKFLVTDNSGLTDEKVITLTCGCVGIEDLTVAKKFSLEQNYPNPFNPVTNIGFNLPNNSNVELIIYNAIGQKVKTMINTNMNSGLHHISWNGKDDNGHMVSSGIYFYKIKAGNFSKSMKMLLLK